MGRAADSGGIRKEMPGNLGASGTLVGVPQFLQLHLHRVSPARVEGLKEVEQLIVKGPVAQNKSTVIF